MKAITESRRAIAAASQALQSAHAADEPADMAAKLAEAGNAIAKAIGTMDATFRGFRRDVETAAKRGEQRGEG